MVCKDTLRIKHLPKELTDAHKEDFVRHFGAISVRVLTSKAKAKSIVYAKFENEDIAKNVMLRLHQILILNCRISVEYSETDVLQGHLPSQKVQDSIDGPDNRYIKNFINNITAFNDSVGFYQPPPAHLKYKYPKANRPTINNIAHALATVPRFYTQVLHLMNRMNLPPPFAMPDAPSHLTAANQPMKIPQSAAPSQGQKRKNQSSSESELESDGEENKRKEIIPEMKKVQKKIVKRPKFIKQPVVQTSGINTSKVVEKAENVFEKVDVVPPKKIELKVNQDSAVEKPDASKTMTKPSDSTIDEIKTKPEPMKTCIEPTSESKAKPLITDTEPLRDQSKKDGKDMEQQKDETRKESKEKEQVGSQPKKEMETREQPRGQRNKETTKEQPKDLIGKEVKDKEQQKHQLKQIEKTKEPPTRELEKQAKQVSEKPQKTDFSTKVDTHQTKMTVVEKSQLKSEGVKIDRTLKITRSSIPSQSSPIVKIAEPKMEPTARITRSSVAPKKSEIPTEKKQRTENPLQTKNLPKVHEKKQPEINISSPVPPIKPTPIVEEIIQDHRRPDLVQTKEYKESQLSQELSIHVTQMKTSTDADGESSEDEFPCISLEELAANQIKDLSAVTAFKNYNPGDPTNKLYIKNCNKNVVPQDLEYIYNRYREELPHGRPTEFNIRLMQEGRMKGQAFVTLDSVEQAQKALNETNGFILKDKPLIVVFGKAGKKK